MRPLGRQVEATAGGRQRDAVARRGLESTAGDTVDMNSTATPALNLGDLIQVDPGRTPVSSLLGTIAAGFPSPAEDHAVKRIDLNDVLIKHPLSTYLMRVRGASMVDAGIDDGDVVLVDKVIKAAHGHVVVAVVDNEFTCKRLWRRGSNVKLQAANPTYPDIVPREGQTIEVWGVVTTVIKRLVP